tara:strand:+ start:84 stop:455 length:372 start_codon:yes stop_codon:yes gene_type:complete
MKLACSRCWDRDCKCTKEELEEYERKTLEYLKEKRERNVLEAETLLKDGIVVKEDIKIKGGQFFYLDDVVVRQGERYIAYYDESIPNLYCVCYPNKFRLVTMDNVTEILIPKDTKLYRLVGSF